MGAELAKPAGPAGCAAKTERVTIGPPCVFEFDWEINQLLALTSWPKRKVLEPDQPFRFERYGSLAASSQLWRACWPGTGNARRSAAASPGFGMLAPKPSDIHALNTPRHPPKPPSRPGPNWDVDTASDHIRTVMHVQTRLANAQEAGESAPDAARESDAAEPRTGTHWMLVGLYWLFVLCVIVALYKWSRA